MPTAADIYVMSAMAFDTMAKYPPLAIPKSTGAQASSANSPTSRVAKASTSASTVLANAAANATADANDAVLRLEGFPDAANAADDGDDAVLRLEGFPDAACNGVYRCVGSTAGDYTNAADYHLFFGRRVGDWVIKADGFEPDCRSATAIADWGRVERPQAGASTWRWWSSGWEDVQATVTLGSAAVAPPSDGAQAAAVAQQGSKAPAKFGELSREIVMLVLHHSRTRRARGAVACVCKGWRDAARERTRRPSIMPGAVMNESSFNSWTAKRMEAAPHSFG
jgi:hypothetical protein